MTMRSIIAAGLFAILSPCHAADLDPARQNILDQFKSKDEPTAIDAVWTSNGVFKVGVRPDGSIRDGYAEYICQEIYSAGLKGEGILVRVVDYPQLMRTGKWVNLGTAHCQ